MSFEQSKSEYFGYGKFSCKDFSVDKRELREKLESELDQFFANGGIAKQLPVGYTESNKAKFNNSNSGYVILETPDSEIEEKNKAIRQQKLERENKAILAEQSKALKEAKVKFIRGDKKRFCEHVGISEYCFDKAVIGTNKIAVETWEEVKKKIATFDFKQKVDPVISDERRRINSVIAARRKAEAEGLTQFEAECKNHGLTKYSNFGSGAVCLKCNIERTSALKRKKNELNPSDRTLRSKINKDLMLKAISEDKHTFTGKCVNCGDSEMKVVVNNALKLGKTFYCIACKQKSREENPTKQKSKPITAWFDRSKKNRAAMNAAIEKGESVFDGNCSCCGDAKMKVKNPLKKSGSHYYVCIACERSNQAKSKKKRTEKVKNEKN